MYEGVLAGDTDSGKSTLGRQSVIQCLCDVVIAGSTGNGMSTLGRHNI